MDKRDYITIAIITLVFAFLVFYRIGSFAAPQSGYELTQENRSLTLDFGETVSFNHISLFLGPRVFLFDIYRLDEASGEWELLESDVLDRMQYQWWQTALYTELRYLRLEAKAIAAINEMVFVTNLGQTVVPANAGDYPGLFDEQGLYDRYLSNTYYSEAMFDETLIASSAYQFIHGLVTTHIAHPPLSKSLISLGIRLFGMTPFGWRFMSAIFGIMMIPLMYAFAKALFDSHLAATAATVLLAFDCMHFTHSRIATIDVFAAFFILLMYYLFFRYLQIDREQATALPSEPPSETPPEPPSETPPETPPRFPRSYIPLALCGLVMGLAVATKWTGAFAGAGLGVMFLFYIIKYRPPQLKRLIGFCLIFFVAMPALIYIISYRPVVLDPPADGLLATVAANTAWIFTLHTTRSDAHDFTSFFYEWPFVGVPLRYTSDPLDFTFISSVNLMGNPAIWWVGLPCLIFCLYRAIAKKDGRAAFLVVAYLAQYLPWFFVGRLTFIYHYYPAALFMILAIGYTLDTVAKARPWGRTAVYGYLAVAVAVFIIFYPVISGSPATYLYQRGLEWLPEWELVTN
ncbi:MAG: glycosyltransferase family 39 protein [Lachnospiraceae bacterium]|jgi:dolichyl-phosphate-mannose--protein O-mannosyl transferase|nr:glycosyltransferase family 39 protein [Lachnospiraceae bacterium]